MYDNDNNKKHYFDTEEFYKKFFAILGAVLITFVVSITAIGLVKAALSSGEISYCFTTMDYNNGIKSVKLTGFREWCPDRLIGVYTNEAEALDMSQKLGCRMGIKR